MRPAEYYSLLSGEHPTIPLGELRGILDVEAVEYDIRLVLEGVALFNARMEDPRVIVERAGWVKEVGLLEAVVDASEDEILRAAGEALSSRENACIEVSGFKGFGMGLDLSGLKNTLKSRARCTRNASTLRILVTEGVAVIGWVMARLDTRSLYYRRPGKRPFFKPGPLSPQLTRAMINMSRLPRGGVFADPFCGTGGFTLEAYFIGASKCFCGDVDRIMARGAKTNLAYYGSLDSCLVAMSNAMRLPLHTGSIDSIACDPPYGRSTSTRRLSYDTIVGGFLGEASNIIRGGGYIVYAGPVKYEPWRLALEAGLSVVERHQMHVHSTLVREVVVARA